MLNFLLNRVSPDSTPDGFGSGFDLTNFAKEEFLIGILFGVLGTLIIFYFKKLITEDNKKYKDTKNEATNNKDEEERWKSLFLFTEQKFYNIQRQRYNAPHNAKYEFYAGGNYLKYSLYKRPYYDKCD